MGARPNNTPFAILGMLSLAPMSGYDIRKESETSIGHFWRESYGQIYPALRDLRAQGLVRRRPGARGDGRDRHVYEITDRGRESLAAWRSEPPRSVPVRSEFLLKLFFGRRDDPGQEIAWLESRLEQERRNLREFGRIRMELLRARKDHPGLPYWLLTLSYGEYHARAVVRWCRRARAELRRLNA